MGPGQLTLKPGWINLYQKIFDDICPDLAEADKRKYYLKYTEKITSQT
jgi:hypothetical protein